MATGLDIVSLGGSGGFGTNATLLIEDGRGLLIDFGIGFPRGLPVGATRVVPDASPLVESCEELVGVVLTHAHDDHVAALPHLPRAWADAPIFGSPFALASARVRYNDSRRRAPEMVTLEPAETRALGPFQIELLPITHSAPQSRAVVVETGEGVLVHTGDFKLDSAPFRGDPVDLAPFEALGTRGVRALLVDSTGIVRPGRAAPESAVEPALDEHIGRATGQVVVSTFASHLERIDAVCSVAARHGRKVALVGQRMNTTVEIGRELGIFDPPAGVLDSLEALTACAPSERLFLAGGCQGEPLSSLGRIAAAAHPAVTLEPGDSVVLSSSVIPGSEVPISQLLDRLLRSGIHVVSAREDTRLHASGHGGRDEILEMIETLAPELLLPVHGDRLHLERVAEHARTLTAPPRQVVIAERGEWVRLDGEGARKVAHTDLTPLYLDESGVAIELEVARARRAIGQAGAVFLTVRQEPEADAELLAEAIGIPGWDGARGARHTVIELAERLLREYAFEDDDALEELIARKIANLLRRGARARPRVVVSLRRG